jgi:hypothetical protein
VVTMEAGSMKKEEIQLRNFWRNSNSLQLIIAEAQHQFGCTCHLA